MNMSESNLKWIPIESNPQVMNQLLTNIGVDPKWQIIDVIGLEKDLLHFIARPVAALILLFDVNHNHRHSDEHSCESQSQSQSQSQSDSMYFMRQTIGNACGTIALIHAIANNRHQIELTSNSSLKRFLDSTQHLTAMERGVQLSLDSDICLAHRMCGESGHNQTTIPNDSMPINYHFITLVEINSNIYELDGRLTHAYNRGHTSKHQFLYDAANLCQQYITRDANNLNASVLALVKHN